MLPEEPDFELLMRQQEAERHCVVERNCLFCPELCSGSWQTYIAHMQDQHGFNVGPAENLVYVSEFVDKLEANMKSLVCIYCELTFKSYSVLRQHMRKKKHLRIKRTNAAYKKYFIPNSRTEQSGTSDDESSGAEQPDEAWDGWVEPSDGSVQGRNAQCLFCPWALGTGRDCLKHLIDEHKFDFLALKAEWKLDFYESVSLINYIRAKMQRGHCLACEQKFADRTLLEQHMKEKQHCLVKNTSIRDWSLDSEFLKPVIEEDLLITEILSDDEDEK